MGLALALAISGGYAGHIAVAQERSAGPGAPASPSGIAGPGGFIVNPTRVVFENGKRNAQVTLINTRDQSGVYRVSLVRMRMSEDGAIQEVKAPESDEQFADTLVRFSPRQVQLEPRVPLTIRLQLRAPANLPPGEYRSHLVIRAVPPPEPAGGEDPASIQGLRVQITPVYGVAIPVIVRQGVTHVSLALSALELRQPGSAGDPYRLALMLQRAGSRSVYGNLTVTLVRNSGRSRVVGRANGLAVYTPNPVRRIELPLELAGGPPPAGARLDVTFAEPGAEHAPLAAASLPLH